MINIVKDAALSLIPKDQMPPAPVMGAFMVVHKVHATWVYYRKWRIYSNPENFPALLAGHAVHHYAGNYFLVRVSAQCVLIVTRVVACAEQHRVFYHSYLNVKDTINCTYPIVQTPNKVKKSAYRVQDAVKGALKLICETFKLSMCYMDAIAVLSFRADTTDEGVKEAFYNSLKSIDTLAENKQQLLTALNNNKQLISKILKPLPGGVTVEVLINGVANTLNGAESISGAVKTSSFWRGLTNVVHSILIAVDIPSPFSPYKKVEDLSLACRSPFPPEDSITFEL